jgi:predicted NBD/HSP70 family sugar kinase
MSKSYGSSIVQVKQHNRALIMNRIVQERAISRIDLSRSTGLSKGGISLIINELLKLGLITETRSPLGNPGRVPFLLALSTQECFLIAVDLRRNDGIVSLVDLQGTIRLKKKYSFNLADTPTTILNRICVLIREVLESEKGRRVIGIGVVSPGPVNIEKGVVRNPHNFPGWSDVPIRDTIAERTGVNVVLENVASAYGIAEKYYGKGRKYRNFIAVVVDDGIGSAVIVDNKLYRGSRGYCSEFGHISIERDGLRCTCGNVGCVEMYAALPKMVSQLEHSMDIGAASPFFEGIRMTRHICWDDILEGLRQNDMLAMRLLQKEAELIGSALVSAINLLEPEAVILTSQIAQAKDSILCPLIDYVKDKIVTRRFECPDIVVSEIEDASLAGGAAIVFEHFVNGDFGEYEKVLPILEK